MDPGSGAGSRGGFRALAGGRVAGTGSPSLSRHFLPSLARAGVPAAERLHEGSRAWSPARGRAALMDTRAGEGQPGPEERGLAWPGAGHLRSQGPESDRGTSVTSHGASLTSHGHRVNWPWGLWRSRLPTPAGCCSLVLGWPGAGPLRSGPGGVQGGAVSESRVRLTSGDQDRSCQGWSLRPPVPPPSLAPRSPSPVAPGVAVAVATRPTRSSRR